MTIDSGIVTFRCGRHNWMGEKYDGCPGCGDTEYSDMDEEIDRHLQVGNRADAEYLANGG